MTCNNNILYNWFIFGSLVVFGLFWIAGTCMVLEIKVMEKQNHTPSNRPHSRFLLSFWNNSFYSSKKGGKDQESTQSSTTPDPGYHMGT